MLFDTYRILYNELTYMHQETENNQHANMMGTISSAVIELSSTYIDPFLLAELF